MYDMVLLGLNPKQTQTQTLKEKNKKFWDLNQIQALPPAWVTAKQEKGGKNKKEYFAAKKGYRESVLAPPLHSRVGNIFAMCVAKIFNCKSYSGIIYYIAYVR